MENLTLKNARYHQAKQRIKRIKGFYIHLAVFIVVNGISIFSDTFDRDGFQLNHNLGLILWTAGLLIHGLSVFLPNFIFGKNWEDRKINEIIERNR